MKFLVDKLPTCPSECNFYKMHIANSHIMDTPLGQIPILKKQNKCILNDNILFECKIGNDKFICPFLREFKANAEDIIEKHDNFRISKNIPVKLE